MYSDFVTKIARSTLAVFIGLASTCLSLHAAEWREAPFSATAEKLRAAFSEEEPTKPPTTVTLYRDLCITLDQRHRAIRSEYKIFRIDADSPLLTSISVPWAPWLQRRPEVRARVIATDGRIHQFDPKTTVSASPNAMFGGAVFSDLQVLQAPLPAAQIGAIVEVEIRTEDTAPALAAGQAGAIELVAIGAVLETRVSLDAPSDLALRWRAMGEVGGDPTELSQRGRKRVEWLTGRTEWEGLFAGSAVDRPRIEFSTASSWASVAQEYEELVEEQIGPVPGDWPAAADSTEETISALLAAVHERVRYASVALGMSSIVPRSPSETLSRRYGDCKDKSTLLVALLRERGIDAKVALLQANQGMGDIDPDLPGFGLFNHAIVYVPGPTPMWIDPTDEYARSGELPAVDQGRWVLVAASDTTTVVRTPIVDSTENRIELTKRHVLSDLGEGVKVEGRRSWGEFERQDRRQLAQSDEQDIVEALDSSSREPESRKPVHRVLALTPSLELSRPFERIIETASPDYQPVGSRIIAASFDGVSEVLSALPYQIRLRKETEESEAEPAKPVRLAFPYSASSELRVVPPPGYQLRRLPEPLRADLGPAVFLEEYRVEEDGTVVMRAQFDSRQGEFEGEQAQQLRTELARILERGEVKVEFDNLADLHLSAGRIRAAIDACREVLAENPRDAGHRRRLVLAYLAAGGGIEAKAEARRMVEDSPDALSYLTLGYVLGSDAIGRREMPGMDLDGAIEAFRRSSDLDGQTGGPDYAVARLLTLSPEGILYASGRLDEALAITKELAEDNRSVGALNAHANLLSVMGRHEEVIDLLGDKEFQDAYTPVYLIQGLAAKRGVDTAINRASRSGGNRTSQLRNAAVRLTRARLYKESAALFEAVGNDALSDRNSDADRMFADLYGQMTRHEELTLDPQDPKSIVMRWLIAIHSAPDWRQAIAPLVSRYGKAELASEELGRAFDSWVKASLYEPMPEVTDGDRRADEVLALARYQVDGDDENGYRVRVTWPNVYGRYGAQEVDYFVVREADQYRILDAAEGRLSDLGAAVIDRLDAGNFAGAQRLLDWAAEAKGVSWPEFNFLWTQGPGKSPELARMAAAALMARDPARARVAIEILTADKANTVAFDKGGARASQLALAYGILSDWEQALHWRRQHLQADPTQPAVVILLARDLANMGRVAEALAVYDERIGKNGASDDSMLETRIQRATLALDLEGLPQMIERVESRGGPAFVAWNGAAWASVVKGSADRQAREAADKAARLSSGRSYPVLNTQAAVYALLGESDAARKILLQSIMLARRRVLEGSDWYVAGLVAESYGLLDSARHAYQQANEVSVETQAPDNPIVLARLALERLK